MHSRFSKGLITVVTRGRYPKKKKLINTFLLFESIEKIKKKLVSQIYTDVLIKEWGKGNNKVGIYVRVGGIYTHGQTFPTLKRLANLSGATSIPLSHRLNSKEANSASPFKKSSKQIDPSCQNTTSCVCVTELT